MGHADQPGESPTSAGAPGTRDQCAVWCARGTLPPAPLVAGLQRRGVHIWTCDDVYNAVARACLMQRTTPTGAAALLVLCDPPSLAMLGDAYDALRRFVPRVAVWWYETSGATPNLRPVTLDDLMEWTPKADRPVSAGLPGSPSQPRFTAPIQPKSQSGPGLRLVEAEGGPEPLPAAGGVSPQVLTSEELAMLLGDQPPEQPGRRGA